MIKKINSFINIINPTTIEQFIIDDNIENIMKLVDEFGCEILTKSYFYLAVLNTSLKTIDFLMNNYFYPNDLSLFAAAVNNIDLCKKYNLSHKYDAIVAFEYNNIEFFKYCFKRKTNTKNKTVISHVLKRFDIFKNNDFLFFIKVHYKKSVTRFLNFINNSNITFLDGYKLNDRDIHILIKNKNINFEYVINNCILSKNIRIFINTRLKTFSYRNVVKNNLKLFPAEIRIEKILLR